RAEPGAEARDGREREDDARPESDGEPVRERPGSGHAGDASAAAAASTSVSVISAAAPSVSPVTPPKRRAKVRPRAMRTPAATPTSTVPSVRRAGTASP